MANLHTVPINLSVSALVRLHRMAVMMLLALLLMLAVLVPAAVPEVGRMWMVEPTQRKVSVREPAALVMEVVQAKEPDRA